jgi:hypothetical protein
MVLFVSSHFILFLCLLRKIKYSGEYIRMEFLFFLVFSFFFTGFGVISSSLVNKCLDDVIGDSSCGGGLSLSFFFFFRDDCFSVGDVPVPFSKRVLFSTLIVRGLNVEEKILLNSKKV